MLNYYMSHPLYAVIIIALLLLSLFVLFKAVKSGSERSRKVNELMEKMKKDNELLNKYAILTEDVISESEPEELFHGVGLNLQKKVSDNPDMLSEFNLFNDSRKYIYSLFTFFEDAGEGMSAFFSANTKPLTHYAAEAVRLIFPDDVKEAFLNEYDATDEDNEQVSYDKEKMEEWDKKAAPSIEDGTLKKLCGEYIKSHPDCFI